MSAKEIYHRLLPASIRDPIGRMRRGALDRWVRWRTPGPPLPPRAMLRTVQMTPWVWEFLAVGLGSAQAVRDALHGCGLAGAPGLSPRVLDFGCGLGRTLRFLCDTGWRLDACDVDARSIAWASRALPGVEFAVNDAEPPLPYPAGGFDGLYAVSVFTHFDRCDQDRWAAEVARVLRPGGLAAVTTMGPHALTGFPNLHTRANRDALARDGFFLDPADAAADEFNARGAFHTEDGLRAIFGGRFELLRHQPGGVDGFQDLTVLRRREDV